MGEINYESIIIERIKFLSAYRGITMSQLDANMDWPLSKFSKMLSGDQQINISELTALIGALQISMKDLFDSSFDFRKLLNLDSKEGMRNIFIKVAEANFSEQSEREQWNSNPDTNGFINEIMTRVFYKELNINPELCDIKINQSIISGRQLKISIFALAKAPGITRDLVMGYSFVFF